MENTMLVPRTAATRREEEIVVSFAMSGAIGRTIAPITIWTQINQKERTKRDHDGRL